MDSIEIFIDLRTMDIIVEGLPPQARFQDSTDQRDHVAVAVARVGWVKLIGTTDGEIV